MVALRPKKKSAPVGQVMYPELRFIEHSGLTALTVENAKDLLGWEEVQEPDKDTVPEIHSVCEKHVKLNRNTNNRFIVAWQLQALCQEVLQNHWELNGSTIVIGKYGNVQSGQHRLIALVLADMAWRGPNSAHWQAICPKPPVMDTFVVYGIDESDRVFRTLNCEVRSRPADVYFRSDYYADLDKGDRKTAARMTEAAVKLLWIRTGRKQSKLDGRLTNGEAVDFLNNHKRLSECVRHIMAQNTAVRDDEGKLLTNALSRYLSPGYASAMMYLMAASATDGDDYRHQETRSEKKVSLSRMAAAKAFWSGLAKGDKPLKDVGLAIGDLANNNPEGSSLAEVKAILCKAWNRYVEDKPVSRKALELKYHEEDGGKDLDEFPDMGGIDLGEKHKSADDEEESPSPKEIATAAKAIKEEGLKKMAQENGAPKRKAKAQPEQPVTEGQEEVVVSTSANKGILPPGPLDGCLDD